MLVANHNGGTLERTVTKGAAIFTENSTKILSQAAQHVA
jgi:hypothetical protein